MASHIDQRGSQSVTHLRVCIQRNGIRPKEESKPVRTLIRSRSVGWFSKDLPRHCHRDKRRVAKRKRSREETPNDRSWFFTLATLSLRLVLITQSGRQPVEGKTTENWRDSIHGLRSTDKRIPVLLFSLSSHRQSRI